MFALELFLCTIWYIFQKESQSHAPSGLLHGNVNGERKIMFWSHDVGHLKRYFSKSRKLPKVALVTSRKTVKLNIVELLLYINSSQNWQTLPSHNCSCQHEQIYWDFHLFCWRPCWCVVMMRFTEHFKTNLDDILLCLPQTATFLTGKIIFQIDKQILTHKSSRIKNVFVSLHLLPNRFSQMFFLLEGIALS